jgi:transcriptional regulator with XRE-family HTH domain
MEYIHQVFDGAILRKTRELKGLTQRQVAKYVGVSVTSVSQWENNQRNPRFSNLEPLRDLLGLKMPGWKTATTKKVDGQLLRKAKLLKQKYDLVIQ